MTSRMDDRLKDAVRNNDRQDVMAMLESGADPFKGVFLNGVLRNFVSAYHDSIHSPQKAAFDIAAENRRLDFLLAMVANPGTDWTPRYLVSRCAVTLVPAEVRSSWPFRKNGRNRGVRRNCFHAPSTSSIKGLETMLMYGYYLKLRDIQYVCPLAARDPYHLKVFKFCLAVGPGGRDDTDNLKGCLGLAVGGNTMSINIERSYPNSIEVVRFLLRAGADPNELCFKGESENRDDIPVLFQALVNRDRELIRLLVGYGADTSKHARFEYSHWFHDDEEAEIAHASIQSKAIEVGMDDLLIPPQELRNPDPESLIRELREEFDRPLKKCIPEYSSILLVAMMRSTGEVPPVGLLSELMFQYCPLGFDLWKLGGSVYFDN